MPPTADSRYANTHAAEYDTPFTLIIMKVLLHFTPRLTRFYAAPTALSSKSFKETDDYSILLPL